MPIFADRFSHSNFRELTIAGEGESRKIRWDMRSCGKHPQDHGNCYLVAATTTTTTATAATAVAAATKVSLHHRLGFVDCECTPVEIGSAQPGNCLVGVFFTHFHESETLRPACIAIRNNRHRLDSSILFKRGANIAFRGLKRQISDKHFLSHCIYLICKETSGAVRLGLKNRPRQDRELPNISFSAT